MQQLASFFSTLPVSEALRTRLFSNTPGQRHLFYMQLPSILAAAFPGIDDRQLQELALSSYLYFRFVLYLDDLLDGDVTPTGPGQAEQMLAYVQLHEHAIRGLSNLFPKGHLFWQQFAQCQQSFGRAQVQEQTASGRAGGSRWTLAAFEELAIAKSAVSEALVYALSNLSTDPTNLQAALDCIRQYHLASQYEDDATDFRQDWEKGQRTYAHDLVLEFLAREHIDVSTLTPGQLHQHFYTSGVAEQHLGQAQRYYQQVADQAELLGLAPMHQAASHLATRVRDLSTRVREQVAAATARATQQLQAAA